MFNSSYMRTKRVKTSSIQPESLLVGKGGATGRFSKAMEDVSMATEGEYWGGAKRSQDYDEVSCVRNGLSTIARVFQDLEELTDEVSLAELYPHYIEPEPFAEVLAALWGMYKTKHADKLMVDIKAECATKGQLAGVTSKELKKFVEGLVAEVRHSIRRCHVQPPPDGPRGWNVTYLQKNVGAAIEATLKIASAAGFDVQPWWPDAITRLQLANREYVAAKPKFEMLRAEDEVKSCTHLLQYHQRLKNEPEIAASEVRLATATEKLKAVTEAYQTSVETPTETKTRALARVEESLAEAKRVAGEMIAEAERRVEAARRELEEVMAKAGGASSSSSSSSSSA